MTEVKARLDRVECTVRVSGAPDTTTEPDGLVISPDMVQWEAYLSTYGPKNIVVEDVAVFGPAPDGHRRVEIWCLGDDFDDVPSWIPAPSAWYVGAVAELRAAAEDLSHGRVTR
jgi:hypothetical protein